MRIYLFFPYHKHSSTALRLHASHRNSLRPTASIQVSEVNQYLSNESPGILDIRVPSCRPKMYFLGFAYAFCANAHSECSIVGTSSASDVDFLFSWTILLRFRKTTQRRWMAMMNSYPSCVASFNCPVLFYVTTCRSSLEGSFLIMSIPRLCWSLFPISTLSPSRGFFEVPRVQLEWTKRPTHPTLLLSKHIHTSCRIIIIPEGRMWMCFTGGFSHVRWVSSFHGVRDVEYTCGFSFSGKVVCSFISYP